MIADGYLRSIGMGLNDLPRRRMRGMEGEGGIFVLDRTIGPRELRIPIAAMESSFGFRCVVRAKRKKNTRASRDGSKVGWG